MTLIDNKEKTMVEAIKKAMVDSDSVDILTAFFYFSGFKMIAEELKDKKMRILVGKYIDPSEMGVMMAEAKQNPDFSLDKYEPRGSRPTRNKQKELYTEGFIEFFNKSALHDDTDDQSAYKIFEDKLRNGTLEIKLCNKHQNHAKDYLFHNKPGEENMGTGIFGSSNFTYQGLQGQGELDDVYTDNKTFSLHKNHFNNLWDDAETIDIKTMESDDSFIKDIEKRLWIHSIPEPYKVYIRILHELFGKEMENDIKTPNDITDGQFSNLEYQIDAIKMGIDRVQKYDGVLVADVVGLGKSVIGSAIAYNLDLPVVVIAPPHLKPQWEDYQEQFNLRGARVFSTGKISDVYEHYSKSSRPTLFIIDEAHRFRNEDTDDYKLLHQIVRSHPENKVILLTATPFNNRPEDVFALLKLFQTPSRSTIRSVDNLSLRFRDLIDQYKQLQKLRRSKGGQEEIDSKALLISSELRRLIEMVVIRRSRIDLRNLTRYREDLIRQNIDFANVVGPELLDYDMGKLSDLYARTLNQITGDDIDEGFIGARYKPTSYLKDDKLFLEKYGEFFDDTTLKTAQANLSKFMRKLLVTRFESSKFAFKTTLEKMILSNDIIIRWWDEAGRVPIMKKGDIPDPDIFEEDTTDNFEAAMNDVTNDSDYETINKNGLLTVEKELFDEEYILSVKADRALLKSIHDEWFGSNSLDIDPKLDGVIDHVKKLLNERGDRKIVIFSAYADTTDYLQKEFKNRGFDRVLSYTAKVGTAQMKNIIRQDFDAGLVKEKQTNDYDVLIATDALSEGFNLHRAGVIINYDIPYNPTRVIQRIGRINRINKKVFDDIYIFNCFPTAVGETEIGIKQISTLKIKLINNVIGNDTKTLTNDEELRSFFRDELKNAESEIEQISWDIKHREAYDAVRNDKAFIKDVLSINERSRLVRVNQPNAVTIAFAKKGDHVIFALAEKDQEPQIVSVETAINYFVADQSEKAIKGDASLDHIFIMLRDKLFANHEQPSVRGRRADALTNLKFLRENFSPSKDFCKDLEDIIRNYDDLSEGELKDIAQLRFGEGGPEELTEALDKLKTEFPVHYIQAIKERAERLENEGEVIVLTEELRS